MTSRRTSGRSSAPISLGCGSGTTSSVGLNGPRLRALLAEEEALGVLERSLIEELTRVAGDDPRGGGSDGSKAPNGPYSEVLEAYERRLILQALQACGGVQRDAADLLGLAPTTLNEKLKRLGLRRGGPGA